MTTGNEAQFDFWNGRAGLKWAAMQPRLDRMLSEATTTLSIRVGALHGLRVLDVGCGTGETCALWLQGGAHVTGVDLSAPMLAVATERTRGRATLIQADAAGYSDPMPFDLVVSRLGVMFFADPDAAFANLARGLRPGGRLVFVCWRAFDDNAWVQIPLRTIHDLVPGATLPVPHAPGPFALADRVRLAEILQRAGFAEVAIEALDFQVCLTDSGGAAEAARLASQIGPSGGALADVTDEIRAIATQRLTEALGTHERDGVVELGGALWLVQAVRPA